MPSTLPEKCPYLAVCSMGTVCCFWHHVESLVPFAFLSPSASLWGRINPMLSLGPTKGWFLLSCATCCHLLQPQPSQAPAPGSPQEPMPKPQPKQMLLRLPGFCPGLICAASTGSPDQNPKCPQMTCLKSRRP